MSAHTAAEIAAYFVENIIPSFDRMTEDQMVSVMVCAWCENFIGTDVQTIDRATEIIKEFVRADGEFKERINEC